VRSTKEELMQALLDELPFFLELLVAGLLAGMMYALVALGFVLIYKASQAINFAQGEFVMFGGFLVAVSMQVYGLSLLASIALGFGVMIVIGLLLEWVVLRPLLGRPVIAIIMATIGLASILRGLLLLIWGPLTVNIPLPITEAPVEVFGLLVKLIAVVGAIISILFLAGFSLVFLRSRIGIALRAVADNQTVAQGMGIDVRRYFALTWVTAGVVATIGGILWGNMIGADVHTALIGLKVFPVVILGGLTSIPGAIVGGLIIGAIENVAAGYIDPLVGGGTKDFVPYIIMIFALMLRPYGFFGERTIERV
jgi:branched-chain amino acid transport system permease protein